MIQGFVAETEKGPIGINIWVEGPQERRFLTGLETSFRQRLPIATFRCDSCGFLESYASKDFAAK